MLYKWVLVVINPTMSFILLINLHFRNVIFSSFIFLFFFLGERFLQISSLTSDGEDEDEVSIGEEKTTFPKDIKIKWAKELEQ